MDADERRARDWIHASHAFLACAWVVWRTLEGWRATSSAWGGEFASSAPGRALTLVTLLAGAAALIAIAWFTLSRWRGWSALALLVALAAALWQRRDADAPDLAYVALAIALGLVWRRARSRVVPTVINAHS